MRVCVRVFGVYCVCVCVCECRHCVCVCWCVLCVCVSADIVCVCVFGVCECRHCVCVCVFGVCECRRVCVCVCVCVCLMCAFNLCVYLSCMHAHIHMCLQILRAAVLSTRAVVLRFASLSQQVTMAGPWRTPLLSVAALLVSPSTQTGLGVQMVREGGEGREEREGRGGEGREGKERKDEGKGREGGKRKWCG